MLHVQQPPSMSSTFVSNLHEQVSRYPQHWKSAKEDIRLRGGPCAHTPPLLGNGPYRGTQFNHGLNTPPLDRREMNGNPLLNPNIGGQAYQRVPVVTSNPPLHNNLHAQTTNDNTKTSNARQPFYNSYYSAKRPQSPILPQRDHAAQSEQSAHRRASSDGNAIASHLQIPSSINDSKGSLPEFAAQVWT